MTGKKKNALVVKAFGKKENVELLFFVHGGQLSAGKTSN
jgi:hypothetical protein